MKANVHDVATPLTFSGFARLLASLAPAFPINSLVVPNQEAALPVLIVGPLFVAFWTDPMLEGN